MYERYWLISHVVCGFEMKFLVYGTEEDIQAYMASEFGVILSYSGASDAEVAAGRLLGMKVYLAPKNQ